MIFQNNGGIHHGELSYKGLIYPNNCKSTDTNGGLACAKL